IRRMAQRSDRMSNMVRLPLLLAALTVLLARGDSRADPPSMPPAAKQPGAISEEPPDPYRWLEDVDGERALAWVRQHNAATAQKLETQPLYGELYRQALGVLNSASRLPQVTQRGRW